MTSQDLKQIGDLLDKKLDEKLDQKFDEKLGSIKTGIAVLKFKAEKNEKSITKINNNILKWKSEMFDATDKFMRETNDQREFRTIGSHQINSNTDRIEKIEKKVFGVIVGM